MRVCNAVFVMILGLCVGQAIRAQQLVQPDEFAGRWEVSDGRGGYVGMNILISTTVPSTTTNLIGVPQSLQNLEIGLYHRSHSDVESSGFSFFATSQAGAATWDGRRLRIKMEQKAELPEVHVDLAWNRAAQSWTGIFRRASFRNEAITLTRSQNAHKNPFVGTWFERNALMNNCLHIYEAEDGTLTGWSDDIQIPGRTHYVNGLRPPERAMEHYGEIAKVKVSEPHRIDVELRAYTAMCCSHTFSAVISGDGESLVGNWPAGPNQASRPAIWTRVEGESCISAASHQTLVGASR